jgi:hypothetical protein
VQPKTAEGLPDEGQGETARHQLRGSWSRADEARTTSLVVMLPGAMLGRCDPAVISAPTRTRFCQTGALHGCWVWPLIRPTGISDLLSFSLSATATT